MNNEHREEIKQLYHILRKTEALSKESMVTGAHEGGEKTCIRQFNRMFKRMLEVQAIPEGLFDVLEEDASFGDIRISCALVADYMKRVFSGWFEDKQAEPESDINSLKTFGEKVRQLLPDMVKRGPKKFSKEFKLIIQKAREEAERLESNYIGEEHLLLAVINNSSWMKIKNISAPLDDLRRSLEQSSGVALNMPEDEIRFTDHAKQIIENAVQEAGAMKADVTEVDHLLLALIRDREGSAGKILQIYDVDYKTTRSDVQKQFGRSKIPSGNKFSDQFKQSMEYAREEAHRLLHDYIGTEHLLLAIMMESDTNAARILQKLNVDPGKLKKQIEEACTSSGGFLNLRKKIPFTPRAKQSLEVAAVEADSMGAAQVDTEHLLLALARDKKGIASQILATHDINEDIVREQVMKLPNTGRGHSWKFTSRFKHTMQFAREEAARLGHDYIGTEHLLLAVIQEGECTGVKMLVHLEIDPDDLKKAIEEATGDQSGSPTLSQIPFTPLAKQSLEKAAQEAYMLDAGNVGTGHLILSLVALGQGIAGEVLAARGVTYEQLKEAIGEVEEE